MCLGHYVVKILKGVFKLPYFLISPLDRGPYSSILVLLKMLAEETSRGVLEKGFVLRMPLIL